MYNQTQKSGINVTAKQETQKAPVISCMGHTEVFMYNISLVVGHFTLMKKVTEINIVYKVLSKFVLALVLKGFLARAPLKLFQVSIF